GVHRGGHDHRPGVPHGDGPDGEPVRRPVAGRREGCRGGLTAVGRRPETRAAGGVLTAKQAPTGPAPTRRTACPPRGPPSSYRRRGEETTMSRHPFCPQVEALDGRCLPSGNPAVTIGDVSVAEGSANALIPVSLSAPSTRTVKVDYQTVKGTAVAGSDYE